jgi:hypothetical protein
MLKPHEGNRVFHNILQIVVYLPHGTYMENMDKD